MSRNRKQKKPPVAPPITQKILPQSNVAATQNQAGPPERKPSIWLRIGTMIGLSGPIIAIAGITYTHHQTAIFKEQTEIFKGQLEEYKAQTALATDTYERSTGRLTAEIEYASYNLTPDKFGKEMRTRAFGRDNMPYLKDVETLLRHRPSVFINNVGEEPIEAIKIVTRLAENISIDSPDPLQLRLDDELGIVLREEEKEEIVLTKLWVPETAIYVPLVKGMLLQMLQIQSKKLPNAMHKVHFTITISAKITGSTVYSSGPVNIYPMVWWMPTGFPIDKCQGILKDYQATIDFGPKMAKTMRFIGPVSK